MYYKNTRDHNYWKQVTRISSFYTIWMYLSICCNRIILNFQAYNCHSKDVGDGKCIFLIDLEFWRLLLPNMRVKISDINGPHIVPSSLTNHNATAIHLRPLLQQKKTQCYIQTPAIFYILLISFNLPSLHRRLPRLLPIKSHRSERRTEGWTSVCLRFQSLPTEVGYVDLSQYNFGLGLQFACCLRKGLA
ncbi:unnamed protein product [Lactuca virosa]|uniref:Uncharacterized protein n=1 Tax=Lactuca virosa TaxID=75947 RepID=A0AAU9MWR3_9ASTR|nr:unnamed protein product [Lactuca virosa]